MQRARRSCSGTYTGISTPLWLILPDRPRKKETLEEKKEARRGEEREGVAYCKTDKNFSEMMTILTIQ